MRKLNFDSRTIFVDLIKCDQNGNIFVCFYAYVFIFIYVTRNKI